MPEVVNTAKVAGRRALHFASLDALNAEVGRLAAAKEIKTLGNWSAGQVVQHVAIVMNNSIDGFGGFQPIPLPLRPLLPALRWFMKAKFLRDPMPAGWKLAGKGKQMEPAPISLAEAAENFHAAFERLRHDRTRAPHPAMGTMTPEEYDQLHCRHAEMHLSFLVPSG